MKNPLKQAPGTPGRSREALRGGRSPFTAKSVLLGMGLFIGSGMFWMSDPAKGSVTSWLQGFAPATMTIAGSYLGGFFIGWGARRTLKLTSIIAAIALGVIGLFVSWGWDGAGAQEWVHSASAWVGESVEGAGRYLIGFLPSATAAGSGGVLGFRRK